MKVFLFLISALALLGIVISILLMLPNADPEENIPEFLLASAILFSGGIIALAIRNGSNR